MSRIGKQFIAIPEKVKVKLDGQKVLIDGPKGSLSRILPSLVCCTLDENNQQLLLEKTQNTKLSQALYGLS
jgi:large subunit ribosomal protein L6